MNNLQVTFENLENAGQTFKVNLEGKLSDMNAYDFKSDLISLVKERKSDCIIDLRSLKAMDIIGMNALAIAHKELQNIGLILTILSAKESAVDKVLSLTKFDRVLNLQRA